MTMMPNTALKLTARWIMAAFCVGILFVGCNEFSSYNDAKQALLRGPTSAHYFWARPLKDEDFALFSRLPELGDLDFYWGWANTNIPVRFSDAGLAMLVSLDPPHLQTLFFGHCTNVADASLTYISKLKNVSFLGLVACPRITDVGMQTLAGMPNLTELDLRGCTNITDKGLEYLAAKRGRKWRRIELGGCARVALKTVTNLQRLFPNAKIEKNDLEWSYER